jgi:tRNA (guanine-N7-)-methyltransferase
MGRKKLPKFDYNEQSNNVVQAGKEIFETIAGKWNEVIFEKSQPITVEIGCGNGDYTIGIAQKFSDVNTIGVDVKGSRIFRGAKFAQENGLKNAAFLRTRIHEIEKNFAKGEVDEIWITFPDPRPRDRDERRRLVHPRYLQHYRNISKDGAIVNLKTDNHDFYLYALSVCKEQNLEILAQTNDLYQSEILGLCHGIQTTYEKRYLAEGIKINYLKFRL